MFCSVTGLACTANSQWLTVIIHTALGKTCVSKLHLVNTKLTGITYKTVYPKWTGLDITSMPYTIAATN